LNHGRPTALGCVNNAARRRRFKVPKQVIDAQFGHEAVVKGLAFDKEE